MIDGGERLVTGWPLLLLVLTYSVWPYLVLWVVLRCWPPGHPRREEWLADYDAVPMWRRPFWVGDVFAQCITNGLAARWRSRQGRPRREFGWRFRLVVGTAQRFERGVAVLVMTGIWVSLMVTAFRRRPIRSGDVIAVFIVMSVVIVADAMYLHSRFNRDARAVRRAGRTVLR